MESVSLRAMAKINLGLDVVRRREDGYHEVRMVMQTIRIFDRLLIEKRREPGIELECGLRFLPTDDSNLAVRAAKLLSEQCGYDGGFRIVLEKRIPVAAGLAGGSADAAAVLVGVNRLLELNLDAGRLAEAGLKLGADVPYCLMRGTALAEGIGERLTPLPPCPPCSVLIAKPPVSLSTKYVYENLHAETITDHPDIDGLTEAIRKGSLFEMIPCMGNVLERVSTDAYPVIGVLKEQILETGALTALMSGSGPTVFGLYETKEQCDAAKDEIRRKGSASVVYSAELFQRV